MCSSRLIVLLAVGCLLAVGLSVYAQAPAAPAAPAAAPAPAAPAAPKPAAAPVAVVVELKDIAATVAADADLKTLSKAIEAAGLAETLKGKGPMTLLAPNDKAFAAAYPGEKLEALLKNKEQLVAVLTCHLVADKAVTVADLKKMTESGLTCMMKHKHAVAVKEDAVLVDGAKVVKADVKASNGLIQVIDKCAMPAMEMAPAAAKPAAPAAAPAAAPKPAVPAPAPAPAPAPQ